MWKWSQHREPIQPVQMQMNLVLRSWGPVSKGHAMHWVNDPLNTVGTGPGFRSYSSLWLLNELLYAFKLWLYLSELCFLALKMASKDQGKNANSCGWKLWLNPPGIVLIYDLSFLIGNAPPPHQPLTDSGFSLIFSPAFLPRLTLAHPPSWAQPSES